MPEFPAITHVALTVTSLERSVPWYKALFGSDPILDEDTGPFQRVAWLTSGTLVGLTQFPDLNSTQPFNERRPGLDLNRPGFDRDSFFRLSACTV